MNKKIIIISASVVVLALIIGMGIYAQSGSKSNSVATEQSSKDMPDKCKACPHHSMCADAKESKDDCMSKCGEKKECSEKKEACCKEMKECAEKKEACCKEKKECAEKKDCCEKKDSTKACSHMGECTKACGKKSN
jgi:hypothetical protein